MLNEGVCPNISGFLLSDARLILDKSGFKINKIVETSPPKQIKGEIEESFRVIKITQYNGKTCDLLVCRPL